MFKNLLQNLNLSEDEQRTIFTQLQKEQAAPVDDSSDCESFHSAVSCEQEMKCDARPFQMPTAPATTLQ
jgi:hypothetical protein